MNTVLAQPVITKNDNYEKIFLTALFLILMAIMVTYLLLFVVVPALSVQSSVDSIPRADTFV